MNAPRISDAEWEVMEILWKRHPQTALEVVSALIPHHPWKDQTIRTMLGRLVRKGAVTYTSKGTTFFYSPAVQREQCVRGESRTFFQKILRGATAPTLLRLIQETQLSKAEIAELKRILKEKEKS